MPCFYKVRIELNQFLILKKYKVNIFANDDEGNLIHDIIHYSINVENNGKSELYFPDLYGYFKQINVIKHLYIILKMKMEI